MRILEMSVLFGIFHHREEFLEQVVGIMRARRRFGMVLNAERGHGTMLETLDSVVVQVDVRHFDVVQIEAVRIYRETVILCRDLDLIALETENRMVSAVVAELEFERTAA